MGNLNCGKMMSHINLSKDILSISTRESDELSNNSKTLVLMCSGGVDSIASTHFMMTRYDNNYFQRKVVYHFNHNIRSQNSKMEDKVIEFCEKLNFNYHTATSEKSGAKDEKECRELRFGALEDKFKNSIIVTAHHLNDCVESYLMNCIRGHSDYNPIPFTTVTDKGNVITHPFLFTKKSDFIQYCDRNDLMKFVVDDDTNHVIKGSRRNMIRNKIIPILTNEKIGIESVVKRKMTETLKRKISQTAIEKTI